MTSHFNNNMMQITLCYRIGNIEIDIHNTKGNEKHEIWITSIYNMFLAKDQDILKFEI